MQKIEAVIFDLDGTLVRSEEFNVEAMITTMRLHGMPLTDEEIRTIPGRTGMDVMPAFLRCRGVADADHQAIIDENRGRYDGLWDAGVTLMPHADVILRILHERGLPLAIGTTARRNVVDKFIQRFEFGGFFTAIITGADVAVRKPDPEVYLILQKRLGVEKERLIVVEDTQIGVVAAKDAGLACAAIPSDFFQHQDFSRADFVLSELRDILPIVLGEGV